MQLHSKYNPQVEAERFVKTISGNLDYIVITEPGESYTASAFRKAFPKAKLIAVRYTDTEFLSTDSLWDYVYRPFQKELEFFLLNIIPDECFSNTCFTAWKPADIAWPNMAKKVWASIEKTISLFKSVMYTRTAFGPVWFKNIFINALYAKSLCSVQVQNKNAFFVASGFSLEGSLFTLAEKRLPLVCASSAYDILAKRGIFVSACIATDGGFYAKRLLSSVEPSVPLLLPLESAVPKSNLEKNPLCLLSYGSELETIVCNTCSFPTTSAKRNGTVSGTALELFLEHSTSEVYAFGLDLGVGKSFSHARGHKSLHTFFASTSKLASLENTVQAARLQTGSLEHYAAWFLSLNESKASRITRVGLTEACRSLPKIKSISTSDFEKLKLENKDALIFKSENCLQNQKRKKALKGLLENFIARLKKIDLQEIVTQTSLEKEIIELLAYNQLVSFIKQKERTQETLLKETCEAKLKSIMEKFF